MTDQEAKEVIRQVRQIVLDFDCATACGQMKEEFLNQLGLMTAWVSVPNEIAREQIKASMDKAVIKQLYDCLVDDPGIQGDFEDFIEGRLEFDIVINP